jgi:hypothetical protein
VADGMGGKSGGRKAADQVVLTGRQVFDRYAPTKDDDASELLRQLVLEAHLMIKLTAITAEEEPHSTVAAFLVGPTSCLDGARWRFTRLPLPWCRHGAPHDRPFLRATPDRRRQAHRGSRPTPTRSPTC